MINSGREVDSARSEAAELATLVIAARVEFEAMLNEADEVIAGHSLVRDVIRSLALLRDELDRMANGQVGPPHSTVK